jgi:Putative prokaryotic signal transducing protein
MRLEDPHELVRLTAAANPLMAQFRQQELQKKGIHCQVRGDYPRTGIGEASGFSAEVWVEAAELCRAEAILRAHQGCSEEVVRPDENP